MFKGLSYLIDRLLGLIMWPLAVAVVYYYPEIFSLFIATVRSFVENASPIYIAGAVLFLFFRFNFLPFLKFPSAWNKKGEFSFAERLNIWEHERAHWFFAILTFKFGSRIEVYDKPNEMGAAGMFYSSTNSYNWLITIGPYFFPTFTFLLLPLFLVPYEPIYPFLEFLLGWSISFHIIQNIEDVKRNWKPSEEGSYTDLTTLTQRFHNQTKFSIFRSRVFAIVMIPALNLIVFSFVLLFLM